MALDPVPAMTWQRPAAASIVTSIKRRCSAWLSVGDSPVVPTGTTPVIPCSIWNATFAASRSSSTLPSRNGVTIAV